MTIKENIKLLDHHLTRLTVGCVVHSNLDNGRAIIFDGPASTTIYVCDELIKELEVVKDEDTSWNIVWNEIFEKYEKPK